MIAIRGALNEILLRATEEHRQAKQQKIRSMIPLYDHRRELKRQIWGLTHETKTIKRTSE